MLFDINNEMNLLEKQFLAEEEANQKELATHVFMARGIYTKLHFCIGFFATKNMKKRIFSP